MQGQVCVIISTIGDRVERLRLKDVDCLEAALVVHQRASNHAELGLSGVKRYIKVERDGLSASRNIGLMAADSKYAYFMDDDVEFNLLRIKRLTEWMDANNVDVATCCFQFEDGTLPKSYSKTAFKHNLFTAAAVSSIEICVNVNSVRSRGIGFDENFGLGTLSPSGEEYIFITDCIKAGLNVWFCPISIGSHPKVTSGMDFYSTPEKARAKRRMLLRVFGRVGSFFVFIFWMKKLPKVFGSGHVLSFTRHLLFGSSA